jgi:pimeloyl-ACP methyl ester carboxylesterase
MKAGIERSRNDEVITTSGVLENNNIKHVNFVQQGVGAPVILTHGLAASLHDWDELLPLLVDNGYKGYALDLLGHGESYKPADFSEYTFDAVFDHFSAWIDSLEITEPMILVGHSLGGGVVLQFALHYPERVRALVLVNPFYDIKQLSPVIQSSFIRKLSSAPIINLTPYWMYRFFVDISNFSFYIGQRVTHTIPRHIRNQTALDFTRASSGIYNIVHTLPYLTSDLSRIQQPTLLIWGIRDQTLAPNLYPPLEHYLPNIVSSHAMPICGHVPHQCHPDIFNPYVMEFLQEALSGLSPR